MSSLADVSTPCSENLAERYRQVRQFTDQIVKPLSAEDCLVQSMPDVSPTRWHMAHTTWFFETFILADQGVPEDDAAPVADGDVAPQDASRDGQVPDGPPPPPEECNGEDEDGDGEIDEGVSNICGGCGGIPPEGCQAWVLQAVQNEAGRLNPNAVASLIRWASPPESVRSWRSRVM